MKLPALKRLTFFYLIATICTLNFSASAQSDSETREFREFSSISVRNSAHVYIKQGNKQSVRMEGPEEALAKITTEVNGRELIIGSENGEDFWEWTKSIFSSSNDFDEVSIYITVKELENISVSGSGNLTGEGSFSTDELNIRVSGSGSVNLNTQADFIKTHISGSGNIQLAGKSEFGESSISGSGKLIADELETEKYTIKISGSGNCSIYATEEIEATISGSGKVRYRGEPSSVNSNISGSGSVRKI